MAHKFSTEKLMKKTQRSYEKRDDSGQFRTIFKDNPNFKFWKCQEGEHVIDIIPYVTGQHDPEDPPGEDVYILVVFVHYGVGVNQDAYVCMAKTYKKACPVCEYREQLRKEEDYDEELVKSLYPRKRCLYNVLVYDDPKEQEKGVQIWDVAHWHMEKYLSILSKTPERTSRGVRTHITFSSPEAGCSIAFEKKGTKLATEFLGHRFLERNYTIPDEILEQAVCLDEAIVLPTYDEVKKAFYGGEEPIEDIPPFDEPPVAETPPLAIPDRRRPLAAAPVQEEQAPQQPPKRVPVQFAGDQKTCPVGGKFGEDCDKLESCATCVSYGPCSEEADKLAVAQASNQQKPQMEPTQASRPVSPRLDARPVPPRPAAPVASAPAQPLNPAARMRRPIPVKK